MAERWMLEHGHLVEPCVRGCANIDGTCFCGQESGAEVAGFWLAPSFYTPLVLF